MLKTRLLFVVFSWISQFDTACLYKDVLSLPELKIYSTVLGRLNMMSVSAKADTYVEIIQYYNQSKHCIFCRIF